MMKYILVLLATFLCCLSSIGGVGAFAPSLFGSSVRTTTQPQFFTTQSIEQAQQQQQQHTQSSTTLFGKKAARAQGNERKSAKQRVKKVKDDVIEVEGTVIESLPNAMFRCTIDGAPDTQEPVLATISGKIRKFYVKILVGDTVTIELSPYDLTRGRITFRKR